MKKKVLLFGLIIAAFFATNCVYASDTLIIDDTASAYTSNTGGWDYGDGMCINDQFWVVTNSFTWTPDLSGKEGVYKVFVWYTDSWHNCDTVDYVVNHESGSDTLVIDQSQNGGQWNLLGTYSLINGSNVQLMNAVNRGCADAVAFLQVIPADSIAIDAGGQTKIGVDSTLQLSAEVFPDTTSDKSYTFSVKNGTGEASIDSNNVLTGITEGTVEVIATALGGSNVHDTLQMTVYRPIHSITVSTSSGSNFVFPDSTLQMIANIDPPNVTEDSVLWSVTNITGEASIDAHGLLTGIKTGDVTVEASSIDGSGTTGSMDINIVTPTDSLKLFSQSGEDTIKVGSSLRFEYNVYPDSASKEVTWDVINITGEGSIYTGLDPTNADITGVSRGIIKISITASDGTLISDTVELYVLQPVTSISLTSANGKTSVYSDSTLQINVVVSPGDANDTSLIWSVKNESGTATINSGLVTGVSGGIIKASATAADGSGVSDTLALTVMNHVSSVNVTTESGQTDVYIDSVIQLNAVVSPQVFVDSSIVWESDNEGVATVDTNGLVIGKGEGITTITARAKDGSGVTGTIDITVSEYVGLNNVTSAGISITPIPADNYIIIADKESSIISVTLIDMQGNNILEQSNLRYPVYLPVTNIKAGTYILKIEDNAAVIIQKVVIK